MELPGRNGTIAGGDYRYAFNGMETDPEVSADGNGKNSYTTQFRQYDPRLGRWKSVDPLAAQFPWQSPFCGMDNNPIALNDPLGLSTGNGDGGSGGGKTKEEIEQDAHAYAIEHGLRAKDVKIGQWDDGTYYLQHANKDAPGVTVHVLGKVKEPDSSVAGEEQIAANHLAKGNSPDNYPGNEQVMNVVSEAINESFATADLLDELDGAVKKIRVPKVVKNVATVIDFAPLVGPDNEVDAIDLGSAAVNVPVTAEIEIAVQLEIITEAQGATRSFVTAMAITGLAIALNHAVNDAIDEQADWTYRNISSWNGPGISVAGYRRASSQSTVNSYAPIFFIYAAEDIHEGVFYNVTPTALFFKDANAAKDFHIVNDANGTPTTIFITNDGFGVRKVSFP